MKSCHHDKNTDFDEIWRTSSSLCELVNIHVSIKETNG